MTQIDYTRAAKYFLLQDVWQGFKLGMKYFFAPKATLNYPHEKGPLSPRFRGEHALRRYPNGEESAVSRVNCAKRFARLKRSLSMRNHVKTAHAVQRVTI